MRSITALLIGLVATLATPSPVVRAAEPAPTKRIALSFDDAPRGNGPHFSGHDRAHALIDSLQRARTGPVVFFVKTRGLQNTEGRERIARYARAGHLIANHSHSHGWLSKTPTVEYIADIDRAQNLLAGYGNRRPWFRYPYLDEGTPQSKRDAVRTALAERGLSNGYVTVDNYDWYIESKWQRAARQGCSVDVQALRRAYVDLLMGAVAFYHGVAMQTFGHPVAQILLLHENDLAALFIPDLVFALRHSGWTIISPDEAYAAPLSRQVPKTLHTGQGRLAALAIDAGRTANTLSPLASDEARIDAFLESRKVFGLARKARPCF